MTADIAIFRDKGGDTITIRVRREVITMPIGEWSRMIARPVAASGFDFSQCAAEGGPPDAGN